MGKMTKWRGWIFTTKGGCVHSLRKHKYVQKQ